MKRFYFGLAFVCVLALSFDAAAQRKQRAANAGRQSATAQAATVRTSAQAEPVRALTGQMFGNKILARMSNDRAGFDYVVTKAQVVDGKLQFQGTINAAGKAGASGSAPAAATLVGTLSRARNPWPNANNPPPPRPAAQTSAQPLPQPQGRDARTPETAGSVGQLAQATQSTARTTQTPTAPEGRQPAGGEVTEQTQSLYTEIDTGSGCEIFYLKMQLPPQLTAAARSSQPVQLGVVIAPMDNERGEQINQHVCRIVRSLDSGQEKQALDTQVAELNRLLTGGR